MGDSSVTSSTKDSAEVLNGLCKRPPILCSILSPSKFHSSKNSFRRCHDVILMILSARECVRPTYSHIGLTQNTACPLCVIIVAHKVHCCPFTFTDRMSKASEQSIGKFAFLIMRQDLVRWIRLESAMFYSSV